MRPHLPVMHAASHLYLSMIFRAEPRKSLSSSLLGGGLLFPPPPFDLNNRKAPPKVKAMKIAKDTSCSSTIISLAKPAICTG